MKKKIFILFLYLSHYLGFCQSWTSDELQKANTAVDISILTSEEKEVIKYINLARLYPQKFAKIEVNEYLGPSKFGDYLKKSKYKQSLLTTLKDKAPISPVYFDKDMYSLAQCFANESGKNGVIGHTRKSCSAAYDAECCAYGNEFGRDIAIQLLIDHDVPSLGHRKICLDDSYDKIGVSINYHKIYNSCCVVDFKRISHEANETKKPKKKWYMLFND